MRSKKILALALIALTVGILFLAALMAASALPPRDLTAYWAAAHLVRQNPYSPQLVAELEKANGILIPVRPLLLRNPPWAIPFILPLGMLSYRVGFALWAVFSLVVVVGCAGAVWKLTGIPESIVSILLPLLFGPSIVLLELGQWAVLVLLGITGFLVAIEKRKDWIAGAFLLLVLGKPHVALLFLIAVAIWTVHARRWAVLYSAAIAMAVACTGMLALNPHIFGQFLERIQQVVDLEVLCPNLGGMLYLATGIHALAILPPALGVLWLLFYWSRHRNSWDWRTDGMLVLVCSIACSYYSYPYDEVVALPALISAFALGNRRAFILCFVITDIGYALYLSNIAGHFGYGFMFLWWTGLGWLAAYLLAQTPFLKATHGEETELA
jgi:hypothetical protein